MYANHSVLSWLPPQQDGGAQVLGYHVERRIAPSSRWMLASKELIDELQTTVEDLVEGNEYEFRVIAENKVGQGAPSEATPAVMAKDPWGKCRLATTNAVGMAVLYHCT